MECYERIKNKNQSNPRSTLVLYCSKLYLQVFIRLQVVVVGRTEIYGQRWWCTVRNYLFRTTVVLVPYY